MKRRRGLSADDASLWAHVAKGVKPLPGRTAPYVAASVGGNEKRPPDDGPRPRPDAGKAVPRSAPPLAPIERRMRVALRRGTERVDGVLDLHGHTQDEAHDALRRFLARQQRAGCKLVLVVTGKGAAEQHLGGRGVLKRMVPLWLRAADMRALVIGFEEAGLRHGGAGALYVRLRRPRAAEGS